ncbi:MAG: GerMN domain-containing protein [Pyrinomonadaceae bacterium]|nr:GerMN domain-containing protein [Pyrinomonadaceae bacterium]
MRSALKVFGLILVVGFISTSVSAQSKKSMTVKIYFTDSNDNPNMQDCGKVKAVFRTVPKTKGVARAALNELFKGPTKQEREAGLFSWFSPESKGLLKNINIKNGYAYVNFDGWLVENLGNATTSCGSASFYSEIMTTLMQFPTIKKVFFAVEGDPAAYYEWMQIGECPKELNNCDNSNF